MENQQVVHVAVNILQALDENAGLPLTAKNLSQKQGVALPECLSIIRRLSKAGIVQLSGDRILLRRPMEELTVVEILEALWTREEAPVCQLLFAVSEAAFGTTLEVILRAGAAAKDPSDEGRN